MREAYLVEVVFPASRAVMFSQLRYAVIADTPDLAVGAVRQLLAPGADLRVMDERLSAGATSALALKPGHARLV